MFPGSVGHFLDLYIVTRTPTIKPSVSNPHYVVSSDLICHHIYVSESSYPSAYLPIDASINFYDGNLKM